MQQNIYIPKFQHYRAAKITCFTVVNMINVVVGRLVTIRKKAAVSYYHD